MSKGQDFGSRSFLVFVCVFEQALVAYEEGLHFEKGNLSSDSNLAPVPSNEQWVELLISAGTQKFGKSGSQISNQITCLC